VIGGTSLKSLDNASLRAPLFALLFFFCGVVSVQADEDIRHVTYAPLDRFRACVESVFKKHVVMHSLFGHDFEKASCPLGEDKFREELKSKGYSVLAHDDWVFLVPSDILFQKATPIGSNRSHFERPWKDLLVHVTVTDAPGPESPLSADQLSELKTSLLRGARLVPMSDSDENFTGETAVFRLWYQVYLVHLRKNGPVSIVVLERQSEARSEEGVKNQPFDLTDGRIIYGEMNDGKIKLLWDSPVVQVRYMNALEFQDVDGDGDKEILVGGSLSTGKYEWRTLSIFNVNGEEITRQDCEAGTLYWYANPYGDRACPIAAGGEIPVVLLDCASFPCKIHGGWDEDPIEDATFHLVNGHYVSETANTRKPQGAKLSPAEAPKVQSAVALNAQGLELMKRQEYEVAALKFAEASKLDPASAEFANNAGYAWYKRGSFQMAVTWLDQSTRLDPKRAVAYLNLGDALAHLIVNVSPQEAHLANVAAHQAYEKYLELAPNSKAASDVRKKLAALPPAS
jgi:hypothetical protein